MGLRVNGNKVGRYAASSMSQLSDTDLINKADGDVMQYDSASSKWKNKPTTFSEASSRSNIASGDSLSTIFGKISKFFTDLKAVAFSGSYNDLTNKPNIASLYQPCLEMRPCFLCISSAQTHILVVIAYLVTQFHDGLDHRRSVALFAATKIIRCFGA